MIARGLLTMAPCDLIAREIMGLCRSRGVDAYRARGFAVRICTSNSGAGVWHEVKTLSACKQLLDSLPKPALQRLRQH